MPKVTPDVEDQSVNHMVDTLTKLYENMPLKMVFGVGRKVNTGNFENIDVFAGIEIPLTATAKDVEALKEAASVAAEVGFAITSEETGERYKKIKEAQSGGRK